MSNGAESTKASVDPSDNSLAASGTARECTGESSQSKQDMSQQVDGSAHDGGVGCGTGDTNANVRKNTPLTTENNNDSKKDTTSTSPPTSSQETETKNQPFKNKMSSSDDAKTKKILELLSHRRLLLERLHRCRKAAESRLNLYIENPPSLKHGEESVKQDETKDLTSSTSSSSPTTDQQVKSYQELCQYAMAFTNKKPPAEKISNPARGSISLRRNPSVGKKMQAAVATLTSNVGWVSDGSTSNTNKAQQKQHTEIPDTLAQIKIEEDGFVDGVSENSIATTSVSSHKPLHQMDPSIGSLPSHKKNATSEGRNKKSSKKSHTDLSQVRRGASITMPEKDSTSIGNTIIPTGKLARANKSNNNSSNQPEVKRKRSGSKGARAASRDSVASMVEGQSSSGLQAVPSAAMPLHHNLNGGNEVDFWDPSQANIENLSMDSSMMYSRPLCPETEKLRIRKREIEFRLESIYRDKYAAQLEGDIEGVVRNDAGNVLLPHHESIGYGHGRSLGKKTTHAGSLMHKSWRSTMGTKFNSTMLPGRKKTQWDNVLEEMRWLATDFMEERKWKTSISCALSSTISSEYAEHTSRLSPVKKADQLKPDPSFDQTRDKTDKFAGDAGIHSKDNMDEVIITKCLEDSTYPKPSGKDISFVKNNAKTLCAMIEEYWDSARGDGSKSPLFGVGSTPSNSSSRNRYHSGSEAPNRIKEMSQEEISLSIERITQYCSELSGSADSSVHRLETDCGKEFEKSKIGLRLHIGQLRLLYYVESLWGCERGTSGTIVSGPFGCGKTISIAALLWRRRFKGPQLLLCPASSVVRWEHELNKFCGLSMHIFTDHKATNVTSNFWEHSWKECDVIVCDVSISQVMYNRATMATVVVDGRSSSIQNHLLFDRFQDRPKGKTPKLSKKNLHVNNRNIGSDMHTFPTELNSSKWWNDTISYLLRFETKCVLLECNPLMSKNGSALEGGISVEVLAAKTAFLHHNLFYSFNTGFGKRAFLWAKKRNTLMKKALDEKKEKESLIRGLGNVTDILLDSMNIVTHNQERQNYQSSIAKKKNIDVDEIFPEWTIRLCPMSTYQKLVYDRTCLYARGSLSSESSAHEPELGTDDLRVPLEVDGIQCTDSHIASAKELLRMRRACFHADLPDFTVSNIGSIEKSDILDKDQLGSLLKGNDPTVRKSHSNNSSQPNSESVINFADKSSKLRELLKILHYDCGYDLQHSIDLLGIPSDHQKIRESRKKKVLILAALPEVLVLASNYLNSIGIQNRVMIPHTIDIGNADPKSTSNHTYLSYCQQSLSKFENSATEENYHHTWSSLNLMLTTFAYVGSSSFGLSASNADIVISIDEDWSGRGALHLHSFFMKACTRTHNEKSKRTTFIKLVAEETCEQTFLTEKDENGYVLPLYPLPSSFMQSCLITDIHGNFIVAATRELKDGIIKCTYSGSMLNRNVLRHNNSSLSRVLCTKELLPPDYQTGSELIFLPGTAKLVNKDELNYSLSFGKALTQAELIASLLLVGEHRIIDSGFSQIVFRDENQNPVLTAESVRDQSVSGYMKRYNIFSIIAEKSSSRYNSSKSLSDDKLVSQNRKRKGTMDREYTRDDVETSKGREVKYDKFAIPFLLYQCDNDYDQCKEGDRSASAAMKLGSKRKTSQDNGKVKKKPNTRKVPVSFQSIQVQDGHQGRESLVYYPPMLLSYLSLDDASHADLNGENKKRKSTSDSLMPNNKRLRESISEPEEMPTQHPLDMISPSELLMPSITTPIADKDLNELNLISSNDPDLLESTASFFDSEFMSELDANPTDDIDKEIAKGAFDAVKDLDTIVTDPPPSKTATAMDVKQVDFVNTNPYSFWLDPFEPVMSAVADNEEVSEFFCKQKSFSLETILLYVKRRSTNNYDHASLNFGNAPSIMLSENKATSSNHSVIHDGSVNHISVPTNQMTTQKKKRGGEKRQRASQVHFNPGVTNNLIEQYNTSNPAIHGSRPSGSSLGISIRSPRDEQIKLNARALVSLRHKFFNSIIMSSSIYCGANYDESNKHVTGLENQLNTSSSIRPHSADKEDKDASPLSTSIPSNVDFGPFSIGFISSITQKKHTQTSQIFDGIKLPMGVKIPRRKDNVGSMKASDEKINQWSKEDDELLRQYVNTHGCNWQLICYAFAAADTERHYQSFRSSRQCQERWDYLSKGSLDTGEEIPVSKILSIHYNNEDMKLISSSLDTLLLPVSSEQVNMQSQNTMEEQQSKKVGELRKTHLHQMKRSSRKAQNIPIHNYNNQMVDTSHSESIKVMWPLQFLDYEKHRKQNTGAIFRQQSKGSGSSSQQKPASHQQQSSYQNHTSQRIHGARQSSTGSISTNKSKNQKDYVAQQTPTTLSTSFKSQSPTRSNTPKNNPVPTTPNHSVAYSKVPSGNISSTVNHATNQNRSTQQLPAPVPFTVQQSGSNNNPSSHQK